MRQRVTITVPDEVLTAARERARSEGFPSLSSYVSHLLAEAQRDSLQDLIGDLVAEYGEPTPEDRAWARHLGEGASPRRGAA